MNATIVMVWVLLVPPHSDRPATEFIYADKESCLRASVALNKRAYNTFYYETCVQVKKVAGLP